MQCLSFVLSHPAGAYACVVTALAASVYAWQARSWTAALTAIAAALLTALAFALVPPSRAGMALLAMGLALLQVEFRLPTFGAALVAGLGAGGAGSWLLLAAPAASGTLTPAPRIALAALGTLLLLTAVLRGIRVRTLPRSDDAG